MNNILKSLKVSVWIKINHPIWELVRDSIEGEISHKNIEMFRKLIEESILNSIDNSVKRRYND